MAEKVDKDDSLASSVFYALGEVAFVVLPIIVIVFIVLYEENGNGLFHKPEWALSAAVMFGQSIIKLIAMIDSADHKDGIKYLAIGGIMSIIIVIGLVPSLIIMSLIYITSEIKIWMVYTQMILFSLSIIVFFLLNMGVYLVNKE